MLLLSVFAQLCGGIMYFIKLYNLSPTYLTSLQFLCKMFKSYPSTYLITAKKILGQPEVQIL